MPIPKGNKYRNRTNVPREPHNDVKATEDFLEVVFIAHTIAAALSFFGMTTVSDKPDSKFSIESIEDFNRHIETFKILYQF